MKEVDYWPALFDRVFIQNPKGVFLRRFYLFLPLITLYQSYVFIKNKNYSWLTYWFLGLSILFVGFTSSLNHYQPIIQRLSWYMFPLFLPEVILSTFFISNFKKTIKTLLIILYLCGSLLMTAHYSIYFNVNDLNKLKSFLRTHSEKNIYTDHFTKYSVDLIDGYPEPSRTKRIFGSDFNIDTLKHEDWLLFRQEHINELLEQKHTFPDFKMLQTEKFKEIFEAGGFTIYEKASN
jgi:hypothetical protein